MLGQKLSRYLIRVQSLYHYRRYVPADVRPLVGNRQWWKQSLKTGERRIAEARARALAVEHDRLIANVRHQRPSQRLAALQAEERAVVEAAKREAGRIAVERSNLLYPPYAADGSARLVEALPRAWHRRFLSTTTARIEAEFELQQHQVIAAQQRLGALTLQELELVEEAGGLEQFVAGVRGSLHELDLLDAPSDDEGLAEEQEVRRQVRLRRLKPSLRMLSKLGVELIQVVDPNNPRMTLAAEAWFKERKQGMSAQRRHRVAVRRFVELHGDMPVREVTRELVRSFAKAIEALPDHRRLPTKQRGGLTDPGEDVPRVSAKTVERHLTSIKALLAFTTDQGWTSANVAIGIRPPKDTRPHASRRRPFTREERIRILAQATDEGGENGDMAWLIRLGAYTGARLEELASLPSCNVRKIDGVMCVEIDDLNGRSAKTLGSVRSIPLHPQIAEALITWIGDRQRERVFATFKCDSNGRYSNKVSGDFARLMDRAGLSDPRLTFHSLRHTLKRELSNAGVDPDVRRTILGHAAKDAHDSYASASLWAVSREMTKLPSLF
jgi:integrase